MARPPFTDEHELLRRSIRAFVDKEVTPHVDAWEEAGRIPRELWRLLGARGFLGLEFPAEYGGGGADFLSSVVLGEELARCRSGGVAFSVLVHTCQLPRHPRPPIPHRPRPRVGSHPYH